MNKYELAVVVNVKLEDEERAAVIEKVKEYIGTLCAEIDRCNAKVFKSTETESRLNAIIEVMDDLLGILEEKC